MHTLRRRGCPRLANLPPTISAWKAVPNWHTRDVLPSRQYKDYGLLSPHILVSLVCTGLLIVLPSRQVWTSNYISIAQRKSPYAGRFRGSLLRSSFVSSPFQVRSLRPPSNSPEWEGLKIVLQAIGQSRGRQTAFKQKGFKPMIY